MKFIMVVLIIAINLFSQDSMVEDKEQLKKLFQETWLNAEYVKKMYVLNGEFDELGTRCVPMPSFRKLYRQSPSKRPFKWYIDIEDKVYGKNETIQLDKLNTLVSVGLLKKRAFESKDNGKKIFRFSLTEDGWKSMALLSRKEKCFIYGMVKLDNLNEMQIKFFNMSENEKIYEVRAKEKLVQIEKWSKSKQVQSIFEEIKEAINGKPVKAWFIRKDGKWEPYPKSRFQVSNSRFNKKYIITNLNEPFYPSKKEIIKILEESQINGSQHCFYLPGGSSFIPVDELRKDPYSIIIYDNKNRKPNDKIQKNTIPYIENLVNSNVLTFKVIKKDGFTGKEYSIANKYKAGISKKYSPCLQFPTPKIELFDLRIRNALDKDYYSFFFKGRKVYSKPVWVDDSMLQEWKMIKNILEKGVMTSGAFWLHKKNREICNGGSSSWLAFPSYSDADY